jgi:hypothetical protein
MTVLMHAEKGSRYDIGGQSGTSDDENEFRVLDLCGKSAQCFSGMKVKFVGNMTRISYSRW